LRLGLEVNFLFLDRRGLGHSTLHWARETVRLAREKGDEVVFLTGPVPPPLPSFGRGGEREAPLYLPPDLGPVIRVEEFWEIAELDLDLLHLQDLITPYRLTRALGGDYGAARDEPRRRRT
jgi:hypothetical protein